MNIQDYIDYFQLNFLRNETLIPLMQIKEFDNKSFLIEAEQPITELLILVSGKVKVYTMKPNGKRLLFRFQKPLSILGDVEILTDYNTSAFVESLGVSKAIAINVRDVKKYLINNPEFLQLVIKNLSTKLYTISNASAVNLSYPVIQRYASYLISVTDVSIESHLNTISTADNQEVATLLGTSYRHLNRVMKQLIEMQIIAKHNQIIKILDREALEALSEGSIYE